MITFEAQGFVNENDRSGYDAIPHRNIFDLHGPPPQAEPAPIIPPTAQIRLTGITTILGGKRALFMVQEPTTPGKPPIKEESYILAEGQREGPVHLLEVDEHSGTVKLEREGKTSVIALEIPKSANPSAPPTFATSPTAPPFAHSRTPMPQAPQIPAPLPLSNYK